MIVVVLLLSLMGAGVGFAVGIFIQPTKDEGQASAATAGEAGQSPSAEVAKDAGADKTDDVGSTEADAPAEAITDLNLKIIPIPPVVTTLAAPEGKWIRFEGSILVNPTGEQSPELLAERSGEQVLAFLRTLKLEQLQGPSGFLALKDDLNDTVSALSNGQVRGLLIHGVLVE